MRNNQPVTGQAHEVPADRTLVSRTDDKGRITEANAEFVRICGFEADELLGAPHNIVRHPDMPVEAFRDLWQTIKSGRPWSGVVKNRCKNGDHYWVRANVSPSAEGGYLSVRVRASDDEVRQAEALYQHMRRNPASRLHEGEPVPAGLAGYLWRARKFWQNLRLGPRFAALLAVVLVALLSLTWMAVKEIRAGLTLERTEQSRRVVELAVSLIRDGAEAARQGRLSEAEAQRNVLAQLQALRYDGDNYVWVQTAEPRVVLHPTQPRLNGVHVGDTVDPDGVPLFRRFAELAENPRGGMLEYRWARPGSSTPTPKIGYAAPAQAWGWIVGTGTWIDDIDAAALTHTRPLMIGSAVIVVVLALSFWLFIRQTRQGLDDAKRVLDGLTHGQWYVQVPNHGRNEIGDLLANIGVMRNNVHELIAELRQQVADISARAVELEEQVHASAQAAAQQSVATDAIAATSEQLSSSSHEVEQAGASVRERAEAATGQSLQSVDAVGKLIQDMRAIADAVHRVAAAMGELDGVSADIAGMSQSIGEIAEQTNLLALNAAIEAARAGEQGRGFAVVADEVRKLAGRTGEASRSITALVDTVRERVTSLSLTLGDSVQTVDSGISAAQRASAGIDEIRDGSQQTLAAVQSITDAVAEQHQAIVNLATQASELASAIETLSHCAQANAEAAHAVKQTAEKMDRLAARFRVTPADRLVEKSAQRRLAGSGADWAASTATG